MRYRRLGSTELMVSELGLEVRAALEAGDEAAEATLRAAIDAGVTVFAWDVSDASEDVEPLLIRAAGVDRGRLTLVAVLDILPAAADIGPQVEAIATRLDEPTAEGYLDVIAFPGIPDAAQLAALAEARARGIVRFVGYAADTDAEAPAELPVGLDLLVLGGAPASIRAGIGVIGRADAAEAAALLEGGAVTSVVTPATSVGELSRLLVPAS